MHFIIRQLEDIIIESNLCIKDNSVYLIKRITGNLKVYSVIYICLQNSCNCAVIV